MDQNQAVEDETRERLTYQDAIDEFMVNAKARGLTDKTVSGYVERIKYFKSYLDAEGIDFSQVSARDIRRYILYHSGRGVKNVTINGYVKVVKLFYQLLYTEDLISSDSAEKIKPMKTEKVVIPVLSKEDIRILFQAALKNGFRGLRNQAMLLIMYDCALRSGEVAKLTIEDFNFNLRTVKVRGKGRKERIVSYTDRTSRAVRKYQFRYRRRMESDYLFCRETSKPLEVTDIQKIVWRIGRSVGIKVYPHLIRHTSASHRAMAGMPAFALQKLLGHSDIRTTLRYVHMVEQEKLNKTFVEFSPLEPEEQVQQPEGA